MTALTGQRMRGPVPRPASLAPDRDTAPHFAAECFFLTQLSMHFCLLPAGQPWVSWNVFFLFYRFQALNTEAVMQPFEAPTLFLPVNAATVQR